MQPLPCIKHTQTAAKIIDKDQQTLTINLKETRYYQCISRCVRQMFLCGTDVSSGQYFEHRKQWIKNRMQFLSRHFAIDICSYAIMSNHYHIVLKVNINWLMSLSQEDIISRWSAVFSCKPKMRKLMRYKPRFQLPHTADTQFKNAAALSTFTS